MNTLTVAGQEPMRGIAAEISEINGLLEHLNDVLAGHRERLTPILRPVPLEKQSQDGEKIDVSAPLVDELRIIKLRIRHSIDQIAELNRLSEL